MWILFLFWNRHFLSWVARYWQWRDSSFSYYIYSAIFQCLVCCLRSKIEKMQYFLIGSQLQIFSWIYHFNIVQFCLFLRLFPTDSLRLSGLLLKFAEKYFEVSYCYWGLIGLFIYLFSLFHCFENFLRYFYRIPFYVRDNKLFIFQIFFDLIWTLYFFSC